MDIWHVEHNNFTKLILWRSDKNIFRVTQDGDYKVLLTNSNYTLIDKKYGDLFKNLTDQVTLQNVKVNDPTLNTSADNYIELIITNKIDPSTLNSVDSKGFKIWTYDGNLFVSDNLKNKMIEIDNDELVFNLGFSHFG